jgi:hypothetical protein
VQVEIPHLRRIQRHHVIQAFLAITGITLLTFIAIQANAFGAATTSSTGGVEAPNVVHQPFKLGEAVGKVRGFIEYSQTGNTRFSVFVHIKGKTVKAVQSLVLSATLQHRSSSGGGWEKHGKTRHASYPFVGSRNVAWDKSFKEWRVRKQEGRWRVVVKTKLTITSGAWASFKGTRVFPVL